MTLRTRLTVAFFAISVIPLSAVTLFSYYASERAVCRAAEQQAATMAAELGRRMEWVTADLERRMDRVWPVSEETRRMAAVQRRPRPAPVRPRAEKRVPPPATPDVAGHLALALGDAAPMIESLEIVPGPPAPPAPGAPGAPPPGSGRRGTGPFVVTDSASAGKLVVEMSQVIEKAMEQYRQADSQGRADMTAWSKSMQDRLRLALAAVPSQETLERISQRAAAADTEATRAEAAARAADAEHPRPPERLEPTAAPRVKAFTEVKGPEVNSSVRRNGHEVGRIHARLNMPRVFHTILPARRDQGEVAFAIDAKGQVHAAEGDKGTVAALKAARAIPAPGGRVRSGNDWVVVTRKGPGGMLFGTARPLGRELKELRTVAAQNFGVGFGLIALVFVASVPLAGGMTRNLRTLMRGVQAVSQGDLDTRVPVRSRDEFGKLAGAFNQMAAALTEHEKLVVQQERLRRELELCRQIQNDMLPREPLRLGLAEVKGVSIPAREVGGDFFNYFALPGGEIAVLVGDVSGKGVGAALLMANVQATLRARLPLEQDLAKLAADLDRDLHANTPPEVYLTIFVGIVNPQTGLLRYVNAGHNTQFILRRDGRIQAMPSTGRPLALLPGGPFEERSAPLPAGDLLFFYTDGIVEAENAAGHQFGMERLEAALRRAAEPGADVDGVLAHVETAVRAFRGEAEPSDDATMMALRLGSGGTEREAQEPRP